jgi:hypothetical protein
VLFVERLKNKAVVRYGRRILKQIRLMFRTIHRKGEIEEEAWKERMGRHRELIIKRAVGRGAGTKRGAGHREAAKGMGRGIL